MPVTDEDIARLKAANPGVELHLLSAPEFGVEVVVKSPPPAEWERYRFEQHDKPGQKYALLKQLVTLHTVHPPAQDLAILMARYPALVESLGAQIGEAIGLGTVVTRRKL
jgi:hypothetical protein